MEDTVKRIRRLQLLVSELKIYITSNPDYNLQDKQYYEDENPNKEKSCYPVLHLADEVIGSLDEIEDELIDFEHSLTSNYSHFFQ
jgi:hypothetical protein